LDAKKHYEYIKALQTINTNTPGLKDSLLKSAKPVTFDQFQPFYKFGKL